jgi:hypothetical protein
MKIKIANTAAIIIMGALLGAQSAFANPPGYNKGCTDAKLPPHARYLSQDGTGPAFHTGKFMRGYYDGFNACSLDSDSVSCNKASHSNEYCKGYNAGARQSSIDDDPDEDITPSQVRCKGGSPGSEFCAGYRQGYADNDLAMFSSED